MGATPIVVSIITIVVFVILVILGVRMFSDPARIQKKYAESEDRNNVFVKKYKEADIELYKGMAARLGFVIVLVLMIFVFNYSKTEQAEQLSYQVQEEDIIEQDIPLTKQMHPKLPPPPPPPPQIVVVKDERMIENEAVFDDDEIDLDDVIEIYKDTTSDISVDMETAPVEEEYVEPVIFIVVEDKPEFPGGERALLDYLSTSINYPVLAMENEIQGTVVLRFVVNETGHISDISILKDLGGGCSGEAVRVVLDMPTWKPGRQRGRNVKVYYTLPVRFKLM